MPRQPGNDQVEVPMRSSAGSRAAIAASSAETSAGATSGSSAPKRPSWPTPSAPASALLEEENVLALGPVAEGAALGEAVHGPGLRRPGDHLEVVAEQAADVVVGVHG